MSTSGQLRSLRGKAFSADDPTSMNTAVDKFIDALVAAAVAYLMRKVVPPAQEYVAGQLKRGAHAVLD